MDPREDDVGVVPVGPLVGRGDRRRAAVVIGAIGLLVVIGLASAQLEPEEPPPVAIVPVETGASATDVPITPSTTFEVTPPRLSAAELIEAVGSGSLEHTLVFADARLDVDCGDAHQPCAEPRLAVEGLALDVLPGTLGTAVGIPLPRSLLVLEVQGARLVYRGALIVQSNGTPRYEVLAGGSAARPPDPSGPDRRRGLARAGRAVPGPGERPTALCPAGDARRPGADRHGRPRGCRTDGCGPGRRLGNR